MSPNQVGTYGTLSPRPPSLESPYRKSRAPSIPASCGLLATAASASCQRPCPPPPAGGGPRIRRQRSRAASASLDAITFAPLGEGGCYGGIDLAQDLLVDGRKGQRSTRIALLDSQDSAQRLGQIGALGSIEVAERATQHR